MNFSIKDFFSKCDQISRNLQNWSHLLKKPLIDEENFIFCAVSGPNLRDTRKNKGTFNCQKKVNLYKAATLEHVQLLQEGYNHWFLRFCSNGGDQICDSFNSTLTQTLKKSIQVFYRNFPRDNANVMVTFSLREKCSNTEFFSGPYSGRIRENTEQKTLRI